MGVLDIIFPTSCLECRKEGKYICSECLKKNGSAKLFCLECHKPSIDGATHSKCRNNYSLDFAYSPWEYIGAVRKAILKLKYNFAYKIGEELAAKFTEKIKKEVPILPKNAVLIPIPLHRLRKNWRGFNQAEKMGIIIAEKLGWKFEPNLLKRIKKTNFQAELKGKDRSTNLLGAFSLSSKYHIQHTTYILFDDVLTTGSTLKEAGKVLKRSGADTVWGLTIAA